MNGLFEILSNKEWMIQQEFLHGILPTLQYNITNHSTVGIEREKKSPMAIGQQGQDFLREYQVTEDGEVKPVFDAWGEGDVLGKMKEPFVNVMPVDGPITRNGGACSYGSRDIRDWMMKAADNKYCQGHILHINTPGGSAWAKNDFQQGIEYAHDRGQRVIAFIDGLCASAGMYLASLCDEVYVMNPKDELGCVGVMAAFCTMKSGEKFMSGETYREYYATKSINKNKEMRDIAEDDDATLLIEELDRLEAEFRADMKAAFPKATDEHLDGKIFDAEDVMGILCDGQMMLSEVIQRVFDLANGSAKPIERTSGRKIAKSVKPAAARKAVAAVKNMLNPNNNTINMKEKFPTLFAALQVEEMQMQEGGAFMNEELLANLNAALETAQKEKADALALVESLKAEHATAIEKLNAEHAAAIEAKDAEIMTLTENAGKADEQMKEKDNQIAALEQEKADLNADIEAKQGNIDQLTTELNGAKESLTTAEGQIAEKDQTITDLNAQIEELQHDAGKQPAAGAAPKTNGGGAEAPTVAVEQYVYDNSKSYEENMRLKKEWEASHE
jgi:ClpP class serine protease